MMRYLLFGFDQYYPSGGLNDLRGIFATADEAKQAVMEAYYPYDEWQICHYYSDNTVKVCWHGFEQRGVSPRRVDWTEKTPSVIKARPQEQGEQAG